MEETNYKYGCYNNEYYLRQGPDMKHEDAVHLVLTMKKILEAHNIQFMPMFGTLLGIIREHDFIPWDKDIDMGVWGQDREKFVDLIPEFEKEGIRFACCCEPEIYTFEYGTANCDFYMILPAPKPYTRWMYQIQIHYISKKFFKATEKVDFLGTQFDIPANPKRLLKYWYGRTWYIPKDKKGDYDSGWLIHIRIARLWRRGIRYIKRHWLHTIK